MAMLMIMPANRAGMFDGDTYRSWQLPKIPDTLVYTRCPHCGLEHAWWHKDAWLAEEMGRPAGAPDGKSPDEHRS